MLFKFLASRSFVLGGGRGVSPSKWSHFTVTTSRSTLYIIMGYCLSSSESNWHHFVYMCSSFWSMPASPGWLLEDYPQNYDYNITYSWCWHNHCSLYFLDLPMPCTLTMSCRSLKLIIRHINYSRSLKIITLHRLTGIMGWAVGVVELVDQKWIIEISLMDSYRGISQQYYYCYIPLLCLQPQYMAKYGWFETSGSNNDTDLTVMS